MHVTCPRCQTAYNVPDAELGSRARRLRCVTCSQVWEEYPPAELAPPPPPLHMHTVEVAPRPAPAAVSRVPKRRRALQILVILLALAVLAMLLGHQAIAERWPATVAIFAALGIH